MNAEKTSPKANPPRVEKTTHKPVKRALHKAPVKAYAPKPKEIKGHATTHVEAPKVHGGKYIEAVGRRKSAIARVRLFPKGAGFEINGMEHKKYFPFGTWQTIVESPFAKAEPNEKFGVSARVFGGGVHAQAEAVRHGISRALVSLEEGYRKRLKKLGYLKRDPRVKERRKYGLKKARRAPQWAKR